MTTEEAIKILRTERECVQRLDCDHDCAACDLVMPDEIIISAYGMAIAALREKQERENPEPLTLDELREMDGEPVYLEEPGSYPLQRALVYLFRGIARECVYLTVRNGASISVDLLLQRGGKVYRHKPNCGARMDD